MQRTENPTNYLKNETSWQVCGVLFVCIYSSGNYSICKMAEDLHNLLSIGARYSCFHGPCLNWCIWILGTFPSGLLEYTHIFKVDNTGIICTCNVLHKSLNVGTSIYLHAISQCDTSVSQGGNISCILTLWESGDHTVWRSFYGSPAVIHL